MKYKYQKVLKPISCLSWTLGSERRLERSAGPVYKVRFFSHFFNRKMRILFKEKLSKCPIPPPNFAKTPPPPKKQIYQSIFVIHDYKRKLYFFSNLPYNGRFFFYTKHPLADGPFSPGNEICTRISLFFPRKFEILKSDS